MTPKLCQSPGCSLPARRRFCSTRCRIRWHRAEDRRKRAIVDQAEAAASVAETGTKEERS